MVPIQYTDQEAPELLPSLAVIIIKHLSNTENNDETDHHNDAI